MGEQGDAEIWRLQVLIARARSGPVVAISLHLPVLPYERTRGIRQKNLFPKSLNQITRIPSLSVNRLSYNIPHKMYKKPGADDRGHPDSSSAGISALSGAPDAGSPHATMWQARESIGPYQLVHPIGSGGMGEVWLAEQTVPMHRRVALKLIKAGMDRS